MEEHLATEHWASSTRRMSTVRPEITRAPHQVTSLQTTSQQAGHADRQQPASFKIPKTNISNNLNYIKVRTSQTEIGHLKPD